jgi:hypothetical protein
MLDLITIILGIPFLPLRQSNSYAMLQTQFISKPNNYCTNVYTCASALLCDVRSVDCNARIERNGPHYGIADAGSVNDSYVNGQRLTDPHRQETTRMNRICPYCGEQATQSVAFCSFCGNQLPELPPPAVGVAEMPNQHAEDRMPITKAMVPQPPTTTHTPDIIIPELVPPTPARKTGSGQLEFVLEVLPGLIGLLGIGHMVSGRLPLGIALLVGWLFLRQFLLAAAAASFGIGLLIALPLAIGVPIYSGLQAQRYARGELSTPKN